MTMESTGARGRQEPPVIADRECSRCCRGAGNVARYQQGSAVYTVGVELTTISVRAGPICHQISQYFAPFVQEDLMDVPGIRREFPALRQYKWFQNGGVSITPTPVADVHSRHMQELLDRGPMHIVYPDEEYPRRASSIRHIAEFLKVDATEIALTRGVSEAFHLVLAGRNWQAGDEIVISQEEEAAVLLPVLHLQKSQGIRVVKLPLIEDVDQQLQALHDCLSDRTRLVAVSHVTTDTGYRLPVREICESAREKGVDSFVDVAHSMGLGPFALRELGCDYAGILSYKWMYAPYAAGMLFCRREKTSDLAVSFAGGRSEKWLDFENDTYELHDTAERFQYGPWSWPLVHAWAAACSYLEECGLGNIWQRTSELTTSLKRQLGRIGGVTVETPVDPEKSAALVAMSAEGWTGDELAETLRTRFNMIVKSQPSPRVGIRISIPFFLLHEEIDELAGAVEELADERGNN